MTRAAITPGTQPQRVSRNTITIEPHPLSMTARGGKMIERITRKILILAFININAYMAFEVSFHIQVKQDYRPTQKKSL